MGRSARGDEEAAMQPARLAHRLGRSSARGRAGCAFTPLHLPFPLRIARGVHPAAQAALHRAQPTHCRGHRRRRCAASRPVPPLLRRPDACLRGRVGDHQRRVGHIGARARGDR
eukprot:scaffold189505_cov29-Tisochrysis_lutea.AAC.4